MASALIAGAATADITPNRSLFLFGYPHVPRNSTGVHDPLLSSALYLSDGKNSLLFIANDVIYISRETSRQARQRIEAATGVPAAHITVSATHTHSGPLTGDMISNESDPVVPKTDQAYVAQLEDGIVAAAVAAVRAARPAKAGLAMADGSCLGGNRHDPAGPADPKVPVLSVRDANDGSPIALMVVCSMHPTVLHEDSTLISGDFPAMARQYLQANILGDSCPIIWHTGPCGNQSPRHVTKANTFEEAARLGNLLGQSIAKSIDGIQCRSDLALACRQAFVELPRRQFPSVDAAARQLKQAESRLASLRATGADRREIRTAECDWFGAEETVAMAKAAAEGRVAEAAATVMPAEILLMRVGPWSFASWPGEAFVDFALMVKASCPDCYVISLANGELQGYLVTEQAVRENWYEATNSSFSSPESGMILAKKTIELLGFSETA